MASAAATWHADKDVYDAVKDFHDSCSRQPSMERERHMLKEILEAIEGELRQEGIGTVGILNRFEYVGSTYDGVKIGRDGYEFDVLVILRGGHKLRAKEIPSRPGYYHIEPINSADNPFPMLTEPDGHISAIKAKQKFTGRLEKIKNSNEVLKRYNIKLVYHGPATEMDIYDDGGNKLYSVDMVPTLEIGGGQYVAKSFHDAGDEACNVWRLSTSLKEKAKFDGLDRGNGCRKQTLRVCKAMRVDQSELKTISSYLLKNALFFEDEANSDPDWRQEKLALRVFGVWSRLEQYLENGFMPSFFNREMNLIENISLATRGNLKSRIKRFRTSKIEFLSMLKRIKGQY